MVICTNDTELTSISYIRPQQVLLTISKKKMPHRYQLKFYEENVIVLCCQIAILPVYNENVMRMPLYVCIENDS